MGVTERLAAANLHLAARVEGLEAEVRRLEHELDRARRSRDADVAAGIAIVRRAREGEVALLRKRIFELEHELYPYDTIAIEHAPAATHEVAAFDAPSKTEVDAVTVHGKRQHDEDPPLTPLVPEEPQLPSEELLEVFHGKAGTWFVTDDDAAFKKR